MLECIIVGLGLGGASTAFRLEQRGHNFLVFDNARLSSSKVAGGVMNPVILKRFTLAWKSQEQLKEAKVFYHEMEEYLETKFLTPVEIYRRFASVEEQNNWYAAADNPLLEPFLDTSLEAEIGKGIKGGFRFGRLRHTARLDTLKMLSGLENKLVSQGRLRKEHFQYDELSLLQEGVEYKGVKAKRIIFCEGFGVLENPFFKSVPMVGNKGEYIIIKAPDLHLDVVVKSSIFISPVGEGLFAVGATYNNRDKTPETTLEARSELERKLVELIDVPYQVVDQIAGIRPSTADRRPLVGQHPLYPQVFICNGFGSRGVLTAPMASGELLDYVEKRRPISPEMDIMRYRKRMM